MGNCRRWTALACLLLIKTVTASPSQTTEIPITSLVTEAPRADEKTYTEGTLPGVDQQHYFNSIETIGSDPLPGSSGVFFECDIDTNACLTDLGRNFSWERTHGSSVRNVFKPGKDHTLDSSNGKYMYADVTGQRMGSGAAMTTRVSPPSGETQLCAEFWYMAYGVSLGSYGLAYAQNEVKVPWVEHGSKGNAWHKVNLTLNITQDTPLFLGFSVVQASSYGSGGVAIDDLSVSAGACDKPKGPDVPSGSSTWGAWSFCSVTCGSGFRIRFHNCTGAGCAGRTRIENASCQERSCQRSCGSWLEWSPCSSTCGTGNRRRNKRDCPDESQTEACSNSNRCPSWSPWQQWSGCSRTCGEGVRSRFRDCSGSDCSGSAKEEEKCNEGACPTGCPDRVMEKQEQSGYIYSPGYQAGNDYPRDSNCRWLITVERDHTIKLTVKSFATESRFDYLDIFDGPGSSFKRVAHMSGREEEQDIKSTGHQMYLEFKSDFMTNDKGFYLQYKSEKKSGNPSTIQCGDRKGISSGDYNIVGGQTAGTWPWVVPVIEDRTFGQYLRCTGIILTKRHVLISATCVVRSNSVRRAEDMMVNVGSNDLVSGSSYYAESYVVHPQYNTSGSLSYYDVAILRLNQDLTFSERVAPICLPTRQEDSGTKCPVTGWGRTVHTGGTLSRSLREVQLEILSTSNCEDTYRVKLKPYFICAGKNPRYRSASYGDNAAPLMCEYDGRYHITGTFSFHSESNVGPNGFVNIFHHKKWIEDEIKK